MRNSFTIPLIASNILHSIACYLLYIILRFPVSLSPRTLSVINKLGWLRKRLLVKISKISCVCFSGRNRALKHRWENVSNPHGLLCSQTLIKSGILNWHWRLVMKIPSKWLLKLQAVLFLSNFRVAVQLKSAAETAWTATPQVQR